MNLALPPLRLDGNQDDMFVPMSVWYQVARTWTVTELMRSWSSACVNLNDSLQSSAMARLDASLRAVTWSGFATPGLVASLGVKPRFKRGADSPRGYKVTFVAYSTKYVAFKGMYEYQAVHLHMVDGPVEPVGTGTKRENDRGEVWAKNVFTHDVEASTLSICIASHNAMVNAPKVKGPQNEIRHWSAFDADRIQVHRTKWLHTCCRLANQLEPMQQFALWGHDHAGMPPPANREAVAAVVAQVAPTLGFTEEHIECFLANPIPEEHDLK